MKPARPRPDALDQAKRPKDEVDPTEADGDAALTAEERARLLAELEAEFDAAERSIREEGTISAEEFLKRRRAWRNSEAKLRTTPLGARDGERWLPASRRASREFDAIVDYRRRVAGNLSAQRLEADLVGVFGLITSQPTIGP